MRLRPDPTTGPLAKYSCHYQCPGSITFWSPAPWAKPNPQMNPNVLGLLLVQHRSILPLTSSGQSAYKYVDKCQHLWPASYLVPWILTQSCMFSEESKGIPDLFSVPLTFFISHIVHEICKIFTNQYWLWEIYCSEWTALQRGRHCLRPMFILLYSSVKI